MQSKKLSSKKFNELKIYKKTRRMSNRGILRMSNIIIIIKNNIATWRMTNFFVNLEKNI